MKNTKYTTPERAYSQMTTSSGKSISAKQGRERMIERQQGEKRPSTPEQSRERMIERHRRPWKPE